MEQILSLFYRSFGPNPTIIKLNDTSLQRARAKKATRVFVCVCVCVSVCVSVDPPLELGFVGRNISYQVKINSQT